jgi:uncharacterized protein with von Willebrand factor type A (vWA) domain
MTAVLGDFIRTLRAADIRISTAEAIDAGAVLGLVGYDDRSVLHDALSQVLAKTEGEKSAFTDVFDRFFSFTPFAGETPEDRPDARDAMPGAGGLPGGGTGSGQGQPAGDLADMLLGGDQAGLQMALAEAARAVQLNQIRIFTQRGQFTRRIMEAMGLDGLDERIDNDPAVADRLTEARARLQSQVYDYVERQLELVAANAGRQLREDMLSRLRLSNIDRRDMAVMRGLVRRMAKKLIALHSRRDRRARRGQLDVRRTIRANIEFDGLLFHTVWKKHRVDRPKVMAICDVSGSVAAVSRFLLMFLHSLQEVLPQVRSFAFSGELGEITDLLVGDDIEAALGEALDRYGSRSTDYGRAFADFAECAMADVDHRTTVLILGDARSNYGDPRADILKQIHDRARRVLFLNPEPRGLWGSGDSEMKRLAPHCDRALTCASLRDLERVVAELLRTAV